MDMVSTGATVSLKQVRRGTRVRLYKHSKLLTPVPVPAVPSVAWRAGKEGGKGLRRACKPYPFFPRYAGTGQSWEKLHKKLGIGVQG